MNLIIIINFHILIFIVLLFNKKMKFYQFIFPSIFLKNIVFTTIDNSDLFNSFNYVNKISIIHEIPDKNVFLFKESSLKLPFKTISLEHIVKNKIQNKNIIPIYHVYSKFHYQIIFNRFKDFLNYNEYCLLEESIANIITAYLNSDQKFLFIFENENWLNDESILSYLTNEEKNKIDRYIIRNLDVYPQLQIIPQCKKIYFWKTSNHPFI